MEVGGEFGEEVVVEGELGVGVVGAGVGIGEVESDLETLGRVGEVGEEVSAGVADGGVLPVVEVGAEERGVQCGARGGGGEALVEDGEQLGGLGAVEVRGGFELFGMELGGGVLGVEPEGEDAVEVAGAGVEGSDVLVEPDIACAERERSVRRAQQEVDEAGEAGLFGSLGGRLRCGGELAGGGSEGEVEARGGGVVAGAVEQRGEGVELVGGPGGVAGVLARAVLCERVESGVGAAELLVAGEEFGGGDEVVRVLLQPYARGGEEGVLGVRGAEQLKVGGDEI